jgi:iron(III) transport system substrate-binding protein
MEVLMSDRRRDLLTRREALRFFGFGAGGLIVACGGATTPSPSPAASAAATSAATAAATAAGAPAGFPSYYPASYTQIIEAAKSEPKLQVYSIMSKSNWAPVIEALKAKFSFIDIDATDDDAYGVFDKYYTESASNAKTADVLMSSGMDAWQQFVKKAELDVYKSPEDDKVPAWSKLAAGVYTVSSDPMVIIWNKKLVASPPKTLAALADLVASDTAKYTGKVTTYIETNATGFAANWFAAKRSGQDKHLATIGKIGAAKPKTESSGGRMVDSTIAGETLFGYFVSAITVLPKFPAANDVLGYSLISDGTPVITRGMGITKKAKAPNRARLLVDFILSQEGQIAWAKGGLTPYRSDVADKAAIHLDKLSAEIGQQNLIPFSFDPDLADPAKAEDFRAKLKKALGR